MKKIIKYIIIIALGLLTALYIAHTKEIFEQTDKKTIYHILHDSLFVPGVIISGIGLLIYVSNEGVFDGIAYGVISFIGLFKSKSERKYNSFVEYKEMKHANPMKSGFIVISGLIILALSIVAYVLYASV